MYTAVKKRIKEILAAMNTTELVVEIRPGKENSGPYGIWTRDLCNTGAVLYQLCFFTVVHISDFHLFKIIRAILI